ncbi:hypothetical protein Hamer_G007991 [Homarus americanus]|uniref:Uncharacterized protein n=1 Tax=Homarus americanus TaxID=6706 RepID=A0A8J5JQF4_HOMAM|nr:hypothetical protein Hamer_G007991 [Homarus americanus]
MLPPPPIVWRPTTTCYLHNTSSVAANNMLPLQHQHCGRTCYLHNNSSVAAKNHVLPPQYQQCDGQQPRVPSTIPVVSRSTTTCYLHNTSSVAGNNHLLPPPYQ